MYFVTHVCQKSQDVMVPCTEWAQPLYTNEHSVKVHTFETLERAWLHIYGQLVDLYVHNFLLMQDRVPDIDKIDTHVMTDHKNRHVELRISRDTPQKAVVQSISTAKNQATAWTWSISN